MTKQPEKELTKATACYTCQHYKKPGRSKVRSTVNGECKELGWQINKDLAKRQPVCSKKGKVESDQPSTK